MVGWDGLVPGHRYPNGHCVGHLQSAAPSGAPGKQGGHGRHPKRFERKTNFKLKILEFMLHSFCVSVFLLIRADEGFE